MALAIADGDRAQVLELANDTLASVARASTSTPVWSANPTHSPGQDTAEVVDLGVRGRGLHSAASSILQVTGPPVA